MQPNDLGHYLIPPMGVELGLKFENDVAWLHWWDDEGNLLLTGDERAEKLAIICDQWELILMKFEMAIATIALIASH